MSYTVVRADSHNAAAQAIREASALYDLSGRFRGGHAGSADTRRLVEVAQCLLLAQSAATFTVGTPTVPGPFPLLGSYSVRTTWDASARARAGWLAGDALATAVC
jgi:hypothetical protein